MGRTALSRIAMELFLGLSLLAFTAPAMRAGTITLYPIADTFANAEDATTPQGTGPAVVSGVGVFMSPLWITYFKFDLSVVGSAEITSAVLSLYQIDGYAPFASAGSNLFRIADNSWTEGGLTWTNQPDVYGPAWLFGESPDNGLHRDWSSWTWTPTTMDTTLDPTPGDTILSLRLFETMGTSQAHGWLSSDYINYADVVAVRGTDKLPFLTITTVGGAPTIPEPSTLILLGCGLAGLALAKRRR